MAQSENPELLFKNSPELEYAGEVVMIPITGWVDDAGKVHFYDKDAELSWLPLVKKDIEI